MIPSLLDALFGCWHSHLSRVFTRGNGSITRWLDGPMSYQVCLDCGTEFEYDLATMRRGKKIFRGAERPDMVTLERQLQKELPKLAIVGREKKQGEPAVAIRTAPIRKIR